MVVKISGEKKNIPKLFFSSLFVSYRAHRAVIFAIAQLPCYFKYLYLYWHTAIHRVTETAVI